MSKIETILGDCSEILPSIPDKSIDIVITSPPYNMNLRVCKDVYRSRQIVKELSTKYNSFSDNLPIDDFYEFHLNVLKHLIRISDLVFYNIQIVTGSKRAFFKIMGELNDQLKDVIIWDKGHGQPAMQTGVLNSQFELLLVFGDSPIKRQFSKPLFDRGTLSNVWQIGRGKKPCKEHGATFPEELVSKILDNFKGSSVLDPFMGSGTVGKIAVERGLDFTGIELDPSYLKFADKRIWSNFV